MTCFYLYFFPRVCSVQYTEIVFSVYLMKKRKKNEYVKKAIKLNVCNFLDFSTTFIDLESEVGNANEAQKHSTECQRPDGHR